MSVGFGESGELLQTLRELSKLLRKIEVQLPGDALLMTAQEAAKALRISERTLWKLTHEEGTLHFVTLGRKKLYDVAELKQFILARKIAGPSGFDAPPKAGNSNPNADLTH